MEKQRVKGSKSRCTGKSIVASSRPFYTSSVGRIPISGSAARLRESRVRWVSGVAACVRSDRRRAGRAWIPCERRVSRIHGAGWGSMAPLRDGSQNQTAKPLSPAASGRSRVQLNAHIAEVAESTCRRPVQASGSGRRRRTGRWCSLGLQKAMNAHR